MVSTCEMTLSSAGLVAGLAVQVSRMTSSGPLTLLPYNNSNGEKPVDDCGTSRYANNKYGMSLSQSLWS